MPRRIADWLDDRTGYRSLVSHALDEEIAGGARWAYVFGSGLLTIFALQVVTGLLLMATYTPAIDSAWSSVFYIQNKVAGGWFVRGLHHYGAQAMIIVLGLHLLQVAAYGAYKRPREVTWWFGLVLMQLVLGLGLTGYLLPWDMKGYWATKVATNIAGTLPVVGPALQTLVVGGVDYGQMTLTRFYVLHVGVLPPALVLLAVGHVALFRRHGATPPDGADLRVKGVFYPDQVVRDLGFALLIVAVMAVLTTLGHGAHLDAPADPSVDYNPRPEWYFLAPFQLLKYMPGSLELVGAVVLPGLSGVFLFVLPFLDKGSSNRVRDRLPWLAPIFLGGLGVAGLTQQALHEDAVDEDYQAGVVASTARAERAIELAKHGIPPGGPLEMLRRDPMTRGLDVYRRECLKCHVLDGEGEQEAPDHTGFGSREWILGVLYDPNAEHHFGKTELDGMKPMGKLGEAKLRAATEFLFSQGHEDGDPAYDAALAAKGKTVFENECMDCHLYDGDGAFVFEGPDMTGYASRSWIFNQIKQPDAETQYGELNDMPVFGDDLSDHDIRMVSEFLREQRFKPPAHKPDPNAAAARGEGEDDDEDEDDEEGQEAAPDAATAD